MAKNKGSSFERKICKFLSSWWTEGEREDVFWRNRTRATKDSPNARHQLGDITSLHSSGLFFTECFSIELKTGYSKTRTGKVMKNRQWDLLDIIDGKEAEPTLLGFWKQCYRDAFRQKKIPLLIFKRDHHVPCVCIGLNLLLKLTKTKGVCPRPHLILDYNITTMLYIFEMESFFKWFTPAMARDIIEEG